VVGLQSTSRGEIVGLAKLKNELKEELTRFDRGISKAHHVIDAAKALLNELDKHLPVDSTAMRKAGGVQTGHVTSIRVNSRIMDP
jgi:hypothetical protein